MKLSKKWSSQLKITFNNWRRPAGHSNSPSEKIVSLENLTRACYRYDNHLSSSFVKKQTVRMRKFTSQMTKLRGQTICNTNFFNQCGKIFRVFFRTWVLWNIYSHRETGTFTDFFCSKPQTFPSDVSSFLCTSSTNKGYTYFQLCQVVVFQRGTNLL